MRTNIEHEVNAVEEGHHAFIETGKGLRVKSDTTDDVYHVHAYTTGGRVMFTCDHPVVRGFKKEAATSEWGRVPCKHAALAARRLEREGFVRWENGEWWATEAGTRAIKGAIQRAG